MITLLLITFLTITTLGSLVLIHGVVYAPVGFEDENGYHTITGANLRQAFAYSGPDRRCAGRPSAPAFGGVRYSGPLRRAEDFVSGGYSGA
jgi:hypothetical protein